MPPILRGVALLPVVAVVLGGPLAIGATEVWAMCSLQILVAAAAVLWALAGPASLRGLVLPAAVVLLGLLQLVPLPGFVLAVVSPLASEADTLLGSLSLSRALPCVSVCPGATLAACRQLLLATLLAVVVADLARGRYARRVLGLAVASIGIIVLVLGIRYSRAPDQPVLGDWHSTRGPIHFWKNPLLNPAHSSGFGYWDIVRIGDVPYTVDWWYVGDPVGPYLVSNHFAGCIGLTLPVAIGLLLSVPVRSRGMRIFLGPLAVLAGCTALTVVATAARSRAGVASLLIGLLVLAWYASEARWARRLWAAATLLVALAGIALLGLLSVQVAVGSSELAWMPSGLREPVAKLTSPLSGRIGAWQASGKACLRSPVLGTGLGTYGEVSARLKTSPCKWHFAHNEYLQWLAEAGVAGVVLGGLAVFFVIRPIRSVRESLLNPTERQWTAGLLGALTAIALHSLFDWNLHVPANAFLCAVVLGLLGAALNRERTGAPARPYVGNHGYHWAARVAVLLAAGACALAAARTWEANRLAMPLRRVLVDQWVIDRETHSGLVETATVRPLDAERRERIETALGAARRAEELDPLNAAYAQTLGQAYLHLSQGRQSPELVLAEEWFARSLRLCPVKRANCTTLLEIRLVQSASPSKTPSDPRPARSTAQ